MRLHDAVSYFGSQNKLAEALGISQASVSGWKPERIPLKRALQLEQITKGKLRPNLDEYLKRERRA